MGKDKETKGANKLSGLVKSVRNKIDESATRHAEKVATRRDDIYDSMRNHGVENLRLLRQALPQGSPIEISKLLDKSFVQAYGSAETNEDRADAIDEYVLTCIELYGISDSQEKVRQECIGFMEQKRLRLKVEAGAKATGRAALVLGELALILVPAAGALGKGAKAGGALAKMSKVAQNRKLLKGAGLVVGVGNFAAGKVNRSSLSKARAITYDVKKLVGKIPTAWQQG